MEISEATKANKDEVYNPKLGEHTLLAIDPDEFKHDTLSLFTKGDHKLAKVMANHQEHASNTVNAVVETMTLAMRENNHWPGALGTETMTLELKAERDSEDGEEMELGKEDKKEDVDDDDAVKLEMHEDTRDSEELKGEYGDWKRKFEEMESDYEKLLAMGPRLARLLRRR